MIKKCHRFHVTVLDKVKRWSVVLIWHSIITMTLTTRTATVSLALSIVSNTNNNKLHGVGYSLRIGPDTETSDSSRCKSYTTVLADLIKLQSITNNIRVNSIADCDTASLVLQATQQLGSTNPPTMGVWLGLWVGPAGTFFESERTTLLSLLKTSNLSNIRGIHISLTDDTSVTIEQASQFRNDVKADLDSNGLTNIPVVVAFDLDTYMSEPQLAAMDDSAVQIKVFPRRNGSVSINEASTQLAQQINQLSSIIGTRQIVFGATGWPDQGDNRANEQSMQKWLRDFVCLAEDQNWHYYWYTAFDAPWHREVEGANPNGVTGHYGIYSENGSMKSVLQNFAIDCSPGSEWTMPDTTPATPSPTTAPKTPVPVPTSAPVGASPPPSPIPATKPPTAAPTPAPVGTSPPPSPIPTTEPPTAAPTPAPVATSPPPTPLPATKPPTAAPTPAPSRRPTFRPSMAPSATPSAHPTSQPSSVPSEQPTVSPSARPSMLPSMQPILSSPQPVTADGTSPPSSNDVSAAVENIQLELVGVTTTIDDTAIELFIEITQNWYLGIYQPSNSNRRYQKRQRRAADEETMKEWRSLQVVSTDFTEFDTVVIFQSQNPSAESNLITYDQEVSYRIPSTSPPVDAQDILLGPFNNSTLRDDYLNLLKASHPAFANLQLDSGISPDTAFSSVVDGGTNGDGSSDFGNLMFLGILGGVAGALVAALMFIVVQRRRKLLQKWETEQQLLRPVEVEVLSTSGGSGAEEEAIEIRSDTASPLLGMKIEQKLKRVEQPEPRKQEKDTNKKINTSRNTKTRTNNRNNEDLEDLRSESSYFFKPRVFEVDREPRSNTSSPNRDYGDMVCVARSQLTENTNGWARFGPEYNNEKNIFTVEAPPGKLGVVIDIPDFGPAVVFNVKPTSPLIDQLKVGDRLLSLDEMDVTSLTANRISALIAERSKAPVRTFTLMRPVDDE